MKIKNVGNAILTVAIFVSLSGCSKNIAQNRSDEISNAISVVLDTIEMTKTDNSNYYLGTIEASQTIPLSFSLPGTVEKVLVSEGQSVSKGQTVAILNSASIKNSLEMAEASEKQAQDALKRLTKVYKEGSLPEIKYIDVQTQVQQAVSSLSIAKKNYEDCILKSPLAAMVGKKNIEVGSIANPISPAFTLYKINEVDIKVPIPENEIASIKKGQSAKIQVSALSNKTFIGKIGEIGVSANPISHTYDVKITVANPKQELKPGMICNVFIDNVKDDEALTAPSSAIIGDNAQSFVFALDADGKTVKKKPITLGSYIGNNIIIKSGLNAGDKIVVAGQHKLYDNAQVSIAK